MKAQVSAGEVKHDITESMLEIATGVCGDIHQAAGQFSAMQQIILRAASEHHLQICGGGTHPFQTWQRQEVCDDERYARTLEMFGYLVQQATVFGQHVHVGCPSGDDAIYLMHGLSRFVPHLSPLALLHPTFKAPTPASPRRGSTSSPRFRITVTRPGSATGRNSRGCSAA